MRSIVKSIAGLGVLALAAWPAAAEDIPARKPGLWEMATTGAVGPNQIKAKKRYCLDSDADRALRELLILRMELEVVYNDVSCQRSTIALNGNIVTGEMACRTNSQDDGETAGKDFRWTMTFQNDSDIVLEEHSVPQDVMFLVESNTTEEQRWIGQCPSGMKPGDSLDFGFNYNSDAWPNEANPGNFHESLKIVSKMLKEGTEINKRLGPM